MKFQDLITLALLHEAVQDDSPDEVRIGGGSFEPPDEVKLDAGDSITGKDDKESTEKEGPKVTHYITGGKKLLSMALLVTMSDTKAGMMLKKLLTFYADSHFNYMNNKKEALSCRDRYDKLPNKESDLAQYLLQRAQAYEDMASEGKQQIINDTPEYIRRLQKYIKIGSTNFVNVLQNSPEYAVKSFDELDDKIMTPEKQVVLEFLKDIYRGKDEFEPLTKFVTVEQNEGKDPLFDIVTLYKTLLNTTVTKQLIGNPKRVFDHIAGSRIVRTIVEPTKGKSVLRRKDPEMVKVIFLLQRKKYDRAKEAVLQTNLSEREQADLMINIDKLSKGEMTEADVIRPLYNM